MGSPLLIGSNNRDKAAELRILLSGTRWEVKTLADFDPVPEPVEDADSFDGNALLKAKYFVAQFQVSCVADDSGLEVDALEGAPGVLSARYAGENCSYTDNNRKLLGALAAVPQKKRTARFVCCAAFSDPRGIEHLEFGTIEGTIASECRGSNGFGYDPLFIPEGRGETFGQLSPEAKHGISHRGRAFRQMRLYLDTLS